MRSEWITDPTRRRVSHRYDVWGDDELAVVRRLAGKCTAAEIGLAVERECGIVPRSKAGVSIVAARYGISLARVGYSASELARIMGVRGMAVRRWIEIEALRAERWANSLYWVISEESVIAFLRQYPWLYDLGMIRPNHPLYMIAVAAHRGGRWLGAKEIGMKLSLSPSVIQRMARQGEAPSQKRNREHLVREADLDLWRDAVRAARIRRLAQLRSGMVELRKRRKVA